MNGDATAGTTGLIGAIGTAPEGTEAAGPKQAAGESDAAERARREDLSARLMSGELDDVSLHVRRQD